MRRLVSTSLVFLAAFLATSAQAAEGKGAAEFVAGKHYAVLEEPRSTGAAKDEVEVIEFFWYGCPHCFAVEEHVQQWLAGKPDDVRFLRVPATLSRGWILLARAYYAAEQLGITEQMHKALFETIHRQRNMLRTPDDVAAVFENVAGVSADDFRQAFQSFGTGMKLKEADALARSYPLTGVPSFVIDGKYVTTAGMAGSYEKLIEVVKMLSERELAKASTTDAAAE